MKKLTGTLSMLASLNLLAFFTPFAGEPPQVKLTPAQQADVASGKVVRLLDKQGELVKEGSVAFRVNARQEAVWKVLADFSKYPSWSYKVGNAVVDRELGGNSRVINFTTSVMSMHYYVTNNFPMKDWATWATDHSKTQDCVMDTVGYWRVYDVPGHPNQSDVIQYGKIELTDLCANGFWGIGGFDAEEMLSTTVGGLRREAAKL